MFHGQCNMLIDWVPAGVYPSEGWGWDDVLFNYGVSSGTDDVFEKGTDS